MIQKLWYRVRDFYDASDAAMFFVYAAFVGALLTLYVTLLTASFEYVDPQMTVVVVWFVIATVLATIHAFRNRRSTK